MEIQTIILIVLLTAIVVGFIAYLIARAFPRIVTKEKLVSKASEPATVVAPPPQSPQATIIAKVLVRDDKGFQRDYDLVGESLTIGREDDNNVVLKESSVGRYHARIRKAKEEDQVKFVLADLDSKIGTKLNGKPVEKKVELKNEDLIEIGNNQMRFIRTELPPQSM